VPPGVLEEVGEVVELGLSAPPLRVRVEDEPIGNETTSSCFYRITALQPVTVEAVYVLNSVLLLEWLVLIAVVAAITAFAFVAIHRRKQE
jgi:hypothetical protein